MKTKWIQLWLLAVVSIMLVACNKEVEQATGSSEKITVNIATIGTNTLSVAKEAGFLEEEFAKVNADFDYTVHPSGPPINEGIASKRVDLAVIGEGAILGGANNGLDTKLISVSSDGLHGINNIIAHKDSGITNLKGLKGKQVAVGFGTSHHVFLLKVLDEVGLSADDLTLVNLASTDAHSAFQSGKLDAWVTADFFVGLEKANGAKLLVTAKDYNIYSPTFYVARGEFAKQHPEIVEAYLKALNRAIELENTDYDEYITLAAKSANQEVEAVKALDTIENKNEAPSEKLIEQFQQSAGILTELGFIENEVDVASLVDESFIQKVNKP